MWTTATVTIITNKSASVGLGINPIMVSLEIFKQPVWDEHFFNNIILSDHVLRDHNWKLLPIVSQLSAEQVLKILQDQAA